MLDIMRGWCDYELRDLLDAKERAKICGVPESEIRQGVVGIVLSKSLEESAAQAQKIYDRGQWPKFYFTKHGKGGIRRKTFLENVGGKVVTNFWAYADTGHTDEAKKEMLAIFGGIATFDTPKPTRLVQHILEICPDKDALVLDSFAGSGTTAHAVLNMNKRDGGDRKFILVEMENYAETITAERTRRVIDGYAGIEGTGGSFSFYELGEPLLFADGNINESVPTGKIRAYIWYTETGQPMPDASGNPYFLGEAGGTAYYFHYEKERVTTLDAKFMKSITAPSEGYIIYADQCVLPREALSKYNIAFKKIPRDIAKL
jgi:adenine-specific DNA-methyltransferase